MLTKVRLQNFKLHADTTLEIAPLTVFIGPNNSGKSSVFQALLALRQAASRQWEHLCSTALPEADKSGRPFQFAADQIVDLGDFKDIVRHGCTEIEVEVGVSRTQLKVRSGGSADHTTLPPIG